MARSHALQVSKYPPCPRCAEIDPGEDSVPEHFRKLDALNAPADLEAYGIVTTDLQHEIDVADVIAVYQFREDVRCSMPRRHPHALGYLVRARCGDVLSMGKDCGRQLIANFHRVEHYVRDSQEYHRFGELITGALAQARKRLVEAVSLQERLWAFRALIQDEAPMLAEHFRRRYEERRRLQAAEIPPGIELWDYTQREPARESAELRRLELRSSAWISDLPSLAEQRRQRDQVRQITDRLDAFHSWAGQAARFVTRNGFTAAVDLYDSEPRTYREMVFDARLGRDVERVHERMERVRDRYRVTDEGLVDSSTERVTRIGW